MGLPYYSYRTQIRWRETARGKVIVISKVQEEGPTSVATDREGQRTATEIGLKDLSRSNSTAYSSYFWILKQSS